MSVGEDREVDILVARGWRVFDFGDDRRVVVWDPEAVFLATVPRGLLPAVAALAEGSATLRAALMRSAL